MATYLDHEVTIPFRVRVRVTMGGFEGEVGVSAPSYARTGRAAHLALRSTPV